MLVIVGYCQYFIQYSLLYRIVVDILGRPWRGDAVSAIRQGKTISTLGLALYFLNFIEEQF